MGKPTMEQWQTTLTRDDWETLTDETHPKVKAVASIPAQAVIPDLSRFSWVMGLVLAVVVVALVIYAWRMRPVEVAPTTAFVASTVTPVALSAALLAPCPTPLPAPVAVSAVVSDGITWCCAGVCQEFHTTEEVRARYWRQGRWNVTGCVIGGGEGWTASEQVAWYKTH